MHMGVDITPAYALMPLCCVRARVCVCVGRQAELNERVRMQEFAIATRYPAVLMVLFVCFSYSSGMPLLVPIAFLSFFVFYWAEKILLCVALPSKAGRGGGGGGGGGRGGGWGGGGGGGGGFRSVVFTHGCVCRCDPTQFARYNPTTTVRCDTCEPHLASTPVCCTLPHRHRCVDVLRTDSGSDREAPRLCLDSLAYVHTRVCVPLCFVLRVALTCGHGYSTV